MISSLPDYQWPPEFRAPHVMLFRAMLGTIFYIAYLLGRIASWIKRDTGAVLIIRTDGMGDGLLFEPALESISQTAKPGKLHLWAPALTGELLAGCPHVERFTDIPRGYRQGNLFYCTSIKWRAKIGWALGRWTFDRVIYPVKSPEPLGNWLFTSARAKQRWITAGDTINQFEWQRSKTHSNASRILNTDVKDTHELRMNAAIAVQCGGTSPTRNPIVHLPQSQEMIGELINSWRATSRQYDGTELIGVVPAASMTINAYPLERWVQVLQQLWTKRHTVPVLLGGPQDVHVIDELSFALTQAGVPHFKLDQSKSILETSAIVSLLDGVLSVDTGLAHIAVALTIPTIILVGGGNPGRFFPWPNATHHIALNVATPCAGCNNRCTEPEPICITNISPDQIVNAFNRLKERRVSLTVFEPAQYSVAS